LIDRRQSVGGSPFAAGKSPMRISLLPSLVVLALGIGAGAPPADAQTPVCPPGYYYASDGQCYPGAPPVYAPPVYEIAPPVYQPPLVYDGFGVGIGLGFGGYGGYRGGRGYGGRGGGGGGHR
jgi:hypothetical protein